MNELTPLSTFINFTVFVLIFRNLIHDKFVLLMLISSYFAFMLRGSLV